MEFETHLICIKMKKSILLLLGSMFLGSSVFALDFDQYFTQKTCRVDFHFVGDHQNTWMALSQIQQEPFWGGRTSRMNVEAGLGDFRYRVLDSVSNTLIYTDGFSALFHEWQSTPEAKTALKSFEQTIIFPFPHKTVKVFVDKRTNFDSWENIGELLVNPKDKLIRINKAERVPVQPWITQADVSKAIDIAILAEGYSAKEKAKFYKDAERLKKQLLSHEPFKKYASRLNFYAVAAVSEESGISKPHEDSWKKTAMASHYHTFYAPRYLTTMSVFKTRDFAGQVPYDAIYILANSQTYGGGGIYNHYALTSSDGRNSTYVTVHEFGHSFAGLADEYFREGADVLDGMYTLEKEPWEPNITTMVNFDAKWKKSLPANFTHPTPVADSTAVEVGLYEGGGYLTKGIFRPSYNCRMRTNIADKFCPVCDKSVEKRILFLTE